MKLNAVQDVAIEVSSVFLPVGPLKAAVKHYHQNKLEIARNTLIAEIEAGEISNINLDDDEVIGVFWRFFLATQKGARAANLKLLAKYIAHGIKNEDLSEEGFDRTAIQLESLTRKEIFLIATMTSIEAELPEELEWDKRASQVWQDTQASLIPKVFADTKQMAATAGMATRSGLLVPESAWSGIIYLVSDDAINLASQLGSLTD